MVQSPQVHSRIISPPHSELPCGAGGAVVDAEALQRLLQVRGGLLPAGQLLFLSRRVGGALPGPVVPQAR